MSDYPTRWHVITNNIGGHNIRYQACRQTRALRPGEPVHSGVLQIRVVYHSHEEAQQYVDQLNGGA